MSARIQIDRVLFRKSEIKWQFERPRCKWENNNKQNLEIILGVSKMDLSGPGVGQASDFLVHGNELSGSIK